MAPYRVGDVVAFKDAANVRGTCWDCTGEVRILRLPTAKEARYLVSVPYRRCRKYATADQLRLLDKPSPGVGPN